MLHNITVPSTITLGKDLNDFFFIIGFTVSSLQQRQEWNSGQGLIISNSFQIGIPVTKSYQMGVCDLIRINLGDP